MSPSAISQFRSARYYSTGKTKITLGPFVGGINKTEDSNFISPKELQECINYVIKPDGRLVGRPPVTSYGPSKGLPATGGFNMIGSGVTGSFRLGTAVTGPIVFDSTGLRSWLYNLNTDTWTTIFGVYPTNIDTVFKVLTYGGVYYFLSYDSLNADTKFLKATGTGVAPVNIAAFNTLYLSAVGTGVYPLNANFFFHKDRALVVADGIILWSKATDPNIWAAPDGGYVKFAGDSSAKSFIFQDSLYIFGDSGIWRFTWQADPSIDATLERISTVSVLGAIVYNNEIYVATISGIFKYLNGYLIEISEKINFDWRNRVKNLTGSAQPSLSILEDYLLAGPFGTATQFYYVYDLKHAIWTSWQFTPGNGSRGPYLDEIKYAGSAQNIGIKKWMWTNSGIYSIPADALSSGTVYGGYDTNDVGNHFWMGFKFTTAEIDLGTTNKWKRIFKSLVEATYTAVVFTVGTSKINLLLDGVATVLNPPDNGKLAWGKSFRAKKVALQYDSTGNTIGTATSPAVELNNVDRLDLFIRVGEEVTT